MSFYNPPQPNRRILDDEDVMSIHERFSLIPTKTQYGRWLWLKRYYSVRRPNDSLIFSEEEYLIEKIKGLTVTI